MSGCAQGQFFALYGTGAWKCAKAVSKTISEAGEGEAGGGRCSRRCFGRLRAVSRFCKRRRVAGADTQTGEE